MTENRGLGRIPQFDERSRAYRAISPLMAAQQPPVNKTWRRGQAYDQGQLPQCVAYAGKGMLNTAPLTADVSYTRRTRYSTQAFYDGAQANDEWAGNDYEGTSALGLGRYLLALNYITAYNWCFNLQEILVALSYTGPVAIGVNWYSGMWDPDPNGYLHATGSIVGGHEVELIGVDVTHQRVIGMNSWGIGWGMNGRFYLSFDELATLIADQGDAVVFTR